MTNNYLTLSLCQYRRFINSSFKTEYLKTGWTKVIVYQSTLFAKGVPLAQLSMNLMCNFD